MPLEGEQDSRATSNNTGAHGEGAEPPDGITDVQDSTQTQRCTNDTRAGQRHGTRIVNDPGGRIKPSTPDRPPSTSLEGERGHEPSSSHADDGTLARAHRVQLETEEDCQYKGGTRDHAPALPSMPLEGEQGSWRSTSHTREEAHTPSQTKAAQQHCEDGQRNERTKRLQSRPAQPRQRQGCKLSSCQAKRDGDMTSTCTGALHDPGGSVHRRSQSRRVEGEIGDQSEGNGSGQDHGPSSDDGATSGTSCDSKQVKRGPLAEDEAHQDRWYMHRLRNDIPEPCTPPTNRPKRPTKPANPPRRRGRLKMQPAKNLSSTREPAPAVYGHVGTPTGPIQPVRCIGYAPGMPGERPRPTRTQAEGPRAQYTKTARPHRQETRDAP
ncbi:hypothetical protein BU15DRAFT_81710 [Melanogaster broomeanus]|nr:hypothetical protein BU15DRAFT_81710 [Melanogaster broomeanus]